MPKKVAIIYGWAEGPWQAKKIKEALQDKDLGLAKNIRQADVIIAHSSGCYLVPKNIKAKLIILIGLPYWPGRSLASSDAKKLISEIRYHRRNKNTFWWLNKIMHNIWYIFTRPHKSLYIFTRHSASSLPDGNKYKTILVRPTDDTFCHPEIMKILKPAKSYAFIDINGAHDDCWLNPKPYIDLLIDEL